MCRLKLVYSIRDIEAILSAAWYVYGHNTGLRKPKIALPGLKLPALIDITVSNRRYQSQAAGATFIPIVCSINEAKRLVYPKTNKDRWGPGGFTFLQSDNNIQRDLKEYMEANINIESIKDAMGRQQQYCISSVLGTISSSPVLVTRKVIRSVTGNKFIQFYVVTQQDAHKLVYYKKHKLVCYEKSPHVNSEWIGEW